MSADTSNSRRYAVNNIWFEGHRKRHLVTVHLFGAGEIGQLAVALVGDVDTMRRHISVDKAFVVQEDDGRLHASRVESCGDLLTNAPTGRGVVMWCRHACMATLSGE